MKNWKTFLKDSFSLKYTDLLARLGSKLNNNTSSNNNNNNNNKSKFMFVLIHCFCFIYGRQMMLDVSQSSSFRQTPNVYNTITPGLHTPGGANTSVSQYGQPPKTPPSPAQRDPFYTQG